MNPESFIHGDRKTEQGRLSLAGRQCCWDGTSWSVHITHNDKSSSLPLERGRVEQITLGCCNTEISI